MRCWARWWSETARFPVGCADRSVSLTLQPWLADQGVVGGVIAVSGAGFVELVIRAGDEVGCAVIEDLVLAAPLGGAPGRRSARLGGGGTRR